MIGYRGIKFRFVIVVLLNLFLLACGGGKSNSTPDTESSVYQKALTAYKNQNYADALNLFQQQISKYPSGSYLFKAYYYSGRSSYSLGNYTVALSQFEAILNQSDSKFILDNAQYWLAKSLHKQGQFDQAQIEYAKVNNLSQWADNAAFQLGKIYYDQAVLATLPSTAYTQFSKAVPILQAMLGNPIYNSSSSFDDALYYLGRSFQEQGNLLLLDSGLAMVETFNSQYSKSKLEYAKLTASSIYFDDANYQVAKIIYEIAGVQIDPIKAYLEYGDAIKALRIFTNDARFINSNRFDDAIFFLAHSFQERGNLLLNNFTLLSEAGAILRATECSDVTSCMLNARTEYARLSIDSNYHDDGLYFSARSFHLEGNFSEARIVYQLIIAANTSNWADDSQYHFAKTYYDSAGVKVIPIDVFNDFDRAALEMTKLAILFPDSSRIDVALYYKGQSLHKQGLLVQLNPKLTSQKFTAILKTARSVYQELLDSEPLSKWADNALHLQAGSYFHEAEYLINAANFVEGQLLLNTAIESWQSLLANPIYKNRNSADNAQYSLGRSYQLALTVPVADRSQISKGVDFTSVTSSTAIVEYNKLIDLFSNSRWIDNSHFNIATIYSNDALASNVILEQQRLFNRALLNLNTIILDYPDQLMEDDAANKIGQIYHDAGAGGIANVYCPLETYWFNYVLTVSKNSILLNNAKNHIDDLNIASPVLPANHNCTATKVISLTVFPMP